MGMDGVILMAFILGLPANEIVIPIIIMTYTSQGTLIEPGIFPTFIRSLSLRAGPGSLPFAPWYFSCFTGPVLLPL